MGRGINTDSILALDKRIEEMTAELTQLKRSRNSLLNSARISPEILGHIFCLSAIPGAADSHFSGLRKDSYNFLLVCHHWSEAARRTPELWGFWGNRFEDWKRQHRRPGTSPLDLVLDEANREVGSFDKALQEALRKYAARDAIRKVHLRGEDIKLLTTIVSTLTPEDDGARDSGIESIVLNGLGGAFCSLRKSDPGVTVVPSFGVDASDFFSRYRFQKLRTLSLSGCFNISSWAWACLKSHAMVLVNLSLSNTPLFTSQILSLLASNPNLRTLVLVLPKVKENRKSGSKPRVLLRRLEKFTLKGEPNRVFRILHRLELTGVDHTILDFHSRMSDEVREGIVPRILDYLHRDPRFGDRLGIFVLVEGDSFEIRACVIGAGYHGPDRLPRHGPPYATFLIRLGVSNPAEMRKLHIDTLGLLPQENIVYFETDLPMAVTKEMVVAMPNLETLYLVGAQVSDGFLLPNPNGPNARKKLLPSLRRLYLQDAQFHEPNPLIRYVAHQTSGNHPFSLNIHGSDVEICPGMEQIEGLVEEFVCGPSPDAECRFHEWDGM